MSKCTHARWLLTIPALAAIGFAGVSTSDGARAYSGRLACEIRVTNDHGVVTLRPMVSTSSVISGSYRLRVTNRGGGGSSQIDQSGGFSASPGESNVLGNVSLAGGGTYDARLTVDAGGRTIECNERVGGWL